MESFELRDEFNRKAIAEKLYTLLISDIDLSPMIIDAPWGAGKTEFCKKMIKFTAEKDQNIKQLYIDSFQYDYNDDPLLMLISLFSTLVEEADKVEYLLKAKPILKVFGKVGLRVASNWIFKESSDKISEEMRTAISDSVNASADSEIDNVFELFKESEKNIVAFQELVKKIASKNKVIVYIDELDRCRPSFALTVLEKLKHIFSVENVKIVILTNSHQLYAVIRKQYGEGIDAEKYLMKFYKYKLNMADFNKADNYTETLNSYKAFEGLLAQNTLLNNAIGHRSTLAMLERLFARDNVSLRDCEMFFRNILIFQELGKSRKFQEGTYWCYSLMWIMGIYIYTFHNQLSVKITSNKVMINDFENLFGISFTTNENLKDSTLEEIVFGVFALDLQFRKNSKLEFENLGLKEKIKHFGHDFPSMGERISIVRNAIVQVQLGEHLS